MANISPSILSARMDDIVHEVQKMEEAGATYIHLDVMDGKFVPATTFGPELVTKIHDVHHMVNDVHLMVEDVESAISSFARAGADIITFHIEAVSSNEEARRLIALIHELGCKAGLSLKPATAKEALLPFWDEIDLCLTMSVEPGAGGQAFMPSSLEKLSYFRSLNEKSSHHVILEVDGGINDKTAPLAVSSGAELLVAGSYLYGKEDYVERAKGLLAL